ncbi:MAG: Glucokinase [Candidatus Anoxychlamydiales bacterium]|nr:Glucokinase [Candidatus Anoxychlamydiales bacterium]NGX41497.1 Glucokinase [Candidatus Anoxychlamydiales bacterium]HEU64730.1 glucokinase [Chlamydiota bacterium]
MLLSGDIGGTNTRLALYEYNKPLKLIKEERFLSSNYSTLLNAIHAFLKNENVKIEAASFGVAGPVRDGKCQATNLPWLIDIHEIAKDLNISKAYLLNDLEANAYGVECLKENELFVLNEGDENAKGNACIVAAGTGLGEAGMYFNGKRHIPFACEGGHTDFGPQNDLEIGLLKFLQKKYGHVSYERILTGAGIYNLYEFLVENNIEPKDEKLDNELKNHSEPQMIITKKGVNKENKTCERVIDWFISMYGAEAGNAALKFFALGAVYIGGGIAPKILDRLQDGSFMKSFADKGRFTKLMMAMPVKVILNDRAALIGASNFALLNKS